MITSKIWEQGLVIKNTHWNVARTRTSHQKFEKLALEWQYVNKNLRVGIRMKVWLQEQGKTDREM